MKSSIYEEIQQIEGNLLHKTEEIENKIMDITKPILTKFKDSIIIGNNSNSNGSYVRWENGLQICTHQLDLSYCNNEYLVNQWVFPASFSKIENISISLIDDNESDIHKRIVFQSNVSNHTAKITLFKGLGSEFKSDEIAKVSLFAIGKWK